MNSLPTVSSSRSRLLILVCSRSFSCSACHKQLTVSSSGCTQRTGDLALRMVWADFVWSYHDGISVEPSNRLTSGSRELRRPCHVLEGRHLTTATQWGIVKSGKSGGLFA
jgi:hypothetical protein